LSNTKREVKQIYSADQLPMIMGADEIAGTLGISRAKAYQLFHRSDFPTIRIDKRLMVRRDKFFSWLEMQS